MNKTREQLEKDFRRKQKRSKKINYLNLMFEQKKVKARKVKREILRQNTK